MRRWSIFAVSALFAVVMAVPMPQHEHHRRDLIWVTSTEEAVVTVPVTTTVWVEPDQVMPTEPAAHQHSQFSFTEETTQAASATSTSAPAPVYSKPVESVPHETPSSSSTYMAPAPEPTTSSSVYVAPAPSTTSVYVGPTTSSSTYVAEAPTSTSVAPTTSVAPLATSAYVAPTTSSSISSPAPSGGSASGPAAPGTTYSGDLTNYTPGLGACGWTNTDADTIVAVSWKIFAAYSDNASNGNYVCGKGITITGVDGKAYKATVTDKCPGCDESALDLPLPFFNQVTNNGDGRVHDIHWVWD